MPFVKGHTTPRKTRGVSKQHDLTPRMAVKVAMLRAGHPTLVSVFSRAFSGKSAKAGIKAFCIECFGYQPREVNGCTSTDCPLYYYRPYRNKP